MTLLDITSSRILQIIEEHPDTIALIKDVDCAVSQGTNNYDVLIASDMWIGIVYLVAIIASATVLCVLCAGGFKVWRKYLDNRLAGEREALTEDRVHELIRQHDDARNNNIQEIRNLIEQARELKGLDVTITLNVGSNRVTITTPARSDSASK